MFDMGFFRLFACLVILCAAPGGFAQESVHTLRQGETLYSLARQYGVTVQAIQTLNGIADPGRIRAGQQIRIPETAGAGVSGGTETGGNGGRYIEYRAVRGDTLYALARQHGTTAAAIREASGLAADYVLKAGDRLRIPSAAARAANGGVPAGGGQAGAQSASGGQTTGGQGSGRQTLAGSPARTTTPARIDPAVVWPVQAREVAYVNGNLGVVLLGERSEPVRSLTQGTVITAGPYRGFGRVAVVQVTGGYYYVYGGCESLSVKEGDQVTPGTELGRLGIDGVTSLPQLFFRVYRHSSPVDPAAAPRS